MTTVSAVKRAVLEALEECPQKTQERFTFDALARSPAALTILANRLSDRGEAGNTAAKANLDVIAEQAVSLATLRQANMLSVEGIRFAAALEWAIDQLTPPDRNISIED